MSFGRSRVAEFHGPEQLIEAGQTILEDPSLDMAVVRQAADFESSGIDRRLLHMSRDIVQPTAQKWLEENLNLSGLDEAVQNWWDHNPSDQYTYLGRAERIGSNVIDIARHLDGSTVVGETWYIDEESLPGPISLSLRIDPNHNHKRTFYARRLDEEPRHLESIPAYVLRLIGGGMQALTPQPMSHVRQEPGDCVIFPNFPLPAIHQVKTKIVVGPRSSAEREAQALIHHYFVKPVAPDVVPINKLSMVDN